jgi:hypothetical protein
VLHEHALRTREQRGEGAFRGRRVARLEALLGHDALPLPARLCDAQALAELAKGRERAACGLWLPRVAQRHVARQLGLGAPVRALGGVEAEHRVGVFEQRGHTPRARQRVEVGAMRGEQGARLARRFGKAQRFCGLALRLGHLPRTRRQQRTEAVGEDALNESYFGWSPDKFASRSEHNLARARSQLSLAASVAAQRSALETVVARIF